MQYYVWAKNKSLRDLVALHTDNNTCRSYLHFVVTQTGVLTDDAAEVPMIIGVAEELFFTLLPDNEHGVQNTTIAVARDQENIPPAMTT